MSMVNYLKKHAAQIVFVGYSLRLIAFGASIGEAIALIAFVAMYAAISYLDKKELDQYNLLDTRMNSIVEANSKLFESMQDDNHLALKAARLALEEEIKNLKEAITSVKLSTQLAKKQTIGTSLPTMGTNEQEKTKRYF